MNKLLRVTAASGSAARVTSPWP